MKILLSESVKKNARDSAGSALPPVRGRGTSGHRAVRVLLAGSIAVALGSCSAGQTDGPAAQDPTQLSPAGPAETAGLEEPLPPRLEMDHNSASGWVVLSEKGEDTGTFVVEGGLQPGQVLSMNASCSPGDTVTITRRETASASYPCTSPSTAGFVSDPASEAVPRFEVTVETAGGSAFWLMAWVHDGK